MNRSIKTTKKQVIEWGQSNINEVYWPVDASEMHTHCWRCGHETNTQRCHVIPDSLGGEDKPYNYRLFCEFCHKEQPNVNDYDATDRWVRKTNIDYYNLFWKLRKAWFLLGEEISYHWGENINQSTHKWRVEKFIERTNIDKMMINSEKVSECLKSMEYIPESWLKDISR